MSTAICYHSTDLMCSTCRIPSIRIGRRTLDFFTINQELIGVASLSSSCNCFQRQIGGVCLWGRTIRTEVYCHSSLCSGTSTASCRTKLRQWNGNQISIFFFCRCGIVLTKGFSCTVKHCHIHRKRSNSTSTICGNCHHADSVACNIRSGHTQIFQWNGNNTKCILCCTVTCGKEINPI